MDEGKTMKHCVATRNDRCISGRSIVFSILGPERSTLELSADGQITEHKTICNGRPGSASISVARKLSALVAANPVAVPRNVRLVSDKKSVDEVRCKFWNEVLYKQSK